MLCTHPRHPPWLGSEVISPISQVEKLRAGEASGLTQTHAAVKSQGWGSKDSLLGSGLIPLPTPRIKMGEEKL